MKLHANAALSLNKRRLLCSARRRGGLVADEGGRGRRSERADRPQVGRAATAPRARPACSTAPRPPSSVHNRTPEDRIQAICALRRLRMTGAEIAEILGMPETTVSGILTRLGPGPARAPGAGARRAATSAPAPASSSTSTSRSSGGSSEGAGHRVTGQPPHTHAPDRRARASTERHRLGVRPRLRRRRHPPRLRRGARRREGDHGGRLPARAQSPSTAATASRSRRC